MVFERVMNRVLLPNLFFEEELQPTTEVGSKNARQLAAELAPVIGLPGLEDLAVDLSSRNQSRPRSVVLVSESTRPDDLPPALQEIEFLTIEELAAGIARERPPDSDIVQHWNAIPWGWSGPAVTAFRKAGLCCDAPNIDVVRLINSRQFQSQFDEARELEGTRHIKAFGTLCRSLPEVKAAIKDASEYSQRGWVIKADLSHACRNRLLGTTPDCSRENLAWLSSRFSSGEAVYVEPWVERISECGLQFNIAKCKPPVVRFIGAAEMLTDIHGRYRGSIVRSMPPEGSAENKIWEAAIQHGHQIAEATAAQGYFGPVGIDCMIYQCPKDNRPWLRLSHDINGRLTMGRVALSLRRWLNPGEIGFWIHSTADLSCQNGNRIDEVSCRGVRIIPTSPGQIGGRAAKTGTAFFVSADSDRLRSIWTQISRQ